MYSGIAFCVPTTLLFGLFCLTVQVSALGEPIMKAALFEEGKDVEVNCTISFGLPNTTISVFRTDKPEFIYPGSMDGFLFSIKGIWSMTKTMRMHPHRSWNLASFMFNCTGNTMGYPTSSLWKELVLVRPTSPKITSQTLVAEDVESHLICESTHGSRAADLSWRRSDFKYYTEVREEHTLNDDSTYNTVSMLVNNFTSDDNGIKITCILRHHTIDGSEETSIILRVETTPIITVDKTEYEAKDGENVTLHCSVSSDVTEVIWFKDDAVVNRSSGRVKEGQIASKSSLIIEHINGADTGMYICCGTKILAKKNSTAIKLIVTGKPYHTKILPQELVSVHEGNKLELKCETRAKPAASFEWFKSNKSVGKNESFVINNITTDFQGEITCKVINAYGSDEASAFILVRHIPIAYEPRLVIRSGPGYPVRLKCNVYAYPPVKRYIWTFKGKVYNQTKMALLIKPESENASIFGNYTCEAVNSVGKSKPVTVTLENWKQYLQDNFTAGQIEALKYFGISAFPVKVDKGYSSMRMAILVLIIMFLTTDCTLLYIMHLRSKRAKAERKRLEALERENQQ